MTRKERNALYYQKNREKIKARARERARERRMRLNGEQSADLVANGMAKTLGATSGHESVPFIEDCGRASPTSDVAAKVSFAVGQSYQVLYNFDCPSFGNRIQIGRCLNSDPGALLPKPTYSSLKLVSEYGMAERSIAPASTQSEISENIWGFEKLSNEGFTSFQHLPISDKQAGKRRSETNQFQSWRPLLLGIINSPAACCRLLFVAAITWLLTILQFHFYQSHDSHPQYAMALALGCELSLISLVVMKFQDKWKDWLRRLAYVLLFLYVIVSLGFDVFHNSRQDFQKFHENSEDRAELVQQLKQAQDALQAATQGRSWDNMRLFGQQADELRTTLSGLGAETTLGVTESKMIQSSAFLVVLLRGILMIVNSLNVCKLREEWLKAHR
ncbi:MAG: hypothetical protein ACOH5I_15295 [Oligoflexus sp.]